MPPKVSVVIPARNAAKTIGRTLAALGAQTLDADEFEVLVVDDGSTDATVSIAEDSAVRVVRQGGLGPGEARNKGVAASEANVIAFTDADCFPVSDWLEQGIAAIASADLVQGKVVPDRNAGRAPFDHTIWVVRESGLYETANLFVRRDKYLQVGGFEDWLDVRIGKRLGEDTWFGWKVRRAGGRTTFCEEALVEHAVFSRRWYEYVNERRRLVYFPDLVQKVPELRGTFLFAGLFTTRRSAAFSTAVAGSAIILRAGGLPPKKPGVLAMLGVWAPYAGLSARRALQGGRFRPRVAVADVAADMTGLAALAWGSTRRRTLVL